MTDRKKRPTTLPPNPPPPFWLLFIQVFSRFSKGWNNMNSSLFVNSSMRSQITHTQAPAFKITCTTSILPWGHWRRLWQPPGTDRSGRGCWTCGQTDPRLQAGCSAMTSWAPGLGSAGCWWCRWQCFPPPRSLTTPVDPQKNQNPVFMYPYSSLKGSLRDAKSQNHFPTKTSGV